MRSAPFFEPDPLERVSKPSSAGNDRQNKLKLYFVFLGLLSRVMSIEILESRLWLPAGPGGGGPGARPLGPPGSPAPSVGGGISGLRAVQRLLPALVFIPLLKPH